MYSKEQQTARYGKIDRAAVDAAAARLRQSRASMRTVEPPSSPLSPGKAGSTGAEKGTPKANAARGPVPAVEVPSSKTAREPVRKQAASRMAKKIQETLRSEAAPEKSWGRGRPRKAVTELMKLYGLSRAEAEERADQSA